MPKIFFTIKNNNGIFIYSIIRSAQYLAWKCVVLTTLFQGEPMDAITDPDKEELEFKCKVNDPDLSITVLKSLFHSFGVISII